MYQELLQLRGARDTLKFLPVKTGKILVFGENVLPSELATYFAVFHGSRSFRPYTTRTGQNPHFTLVSRETRQNVRKIFRCARMLGSRLHVDKLNYFEKIEVFNFKILQYF